MENKLLYKIYIQGQVQGVGFRWNASNEAKKRGINGFVRNLSDGRVYIEAEGVREQLNGFVEWCRRGPAFSSVDSADVESSPPAGYTDFRIAH